MRARADNPAETAPAEAITVTRTLDRWRLLRLVCGLQGLYYLITGLWPILHRLVGLPLYSATNQAGADYATAMLPALTALIGAVLLLAAGRARPDGLLVGLGAATALAFGAGQLRFRHALHWPIYLDIAAEALFILGLLGIYAAARLAERRRRTS